MATRFSRRLRSKLRQTLRPYVPITWQVARLDGVCYAENPDPRHFIFICGLHRSGTTLLERMLAARFDVSYLRMKATESEGQHAQSVYPPGLCFGGPGRFALDGTDEAILRRLSDHAACRARLLRDWSHFIVGSSPVLLEKSPPNLTKIWWLRQVFEGARFVVMTRDPRAVSVATEKWSGESHTLMMENWHAAHGRALRDSDPVDTIHVRYEDLCAEPEATLARLRVFLDLAPNAGEIEDRFSTLENSNPKYIPRFDGEIRPDGAWKAFGYDL